MSGLTLISLLLAPGLALPAQAISLIYPDGANGVGEDDDILAYACPGALELQIPQPTSDSTDRYSSRTPAQIDLFQWSISSSTDKGGTYEPTPLEETGFQEENSSQGFLLEDQTWDVGDVLYLRLMGQTRDSANVESAYGDPVEFQVTVVDPSFENGSGTIADPYMVTNADDLKKLRCYTNKHFKLANDISLNDEKWLPIGVDDEWNGTLDGAGFEISGLKIDNVTLNNSGLFGYTQDAYIYNLTLKAPSITARSKVGALVADMDRTVIDNVNVTDADITALSKTGLLVGYMDEDSAIRNTSVSGSISASPQVQEDFYTSDKFETFEVADIGGMVGDADGKNFSHMNNTVDVDIQIFPETDYPATGLDLDHSSDVDNVGGYIGNSIGEPDASSGDQFGRARFINVDATINIQAFGNVDYVGGFAGESDMSVSNSNIDSDIQIVSLGSLGSPREDRRIRFVGGLKGKRELAPLSFSNLNTKISIENSTADNSTLELAPANTNFTVTKVGGVAGENENNNDDIFNRVTNDIDVIDAASATEIAGYVGHHEDADEQTSSDLFVSGTIDIDAPVITDVAGFANDGDAVVHLGPRLVTATAITTADGATLTNVNPFMGTLNNTGDVQRGNFSYWDSDLNSASNPAGYPATGVTTASLQSESFLKSAGFDLDNIWELDGGYPILRAANYTFGASLTINNSGDSDPEPAPEPAPSPSPDPYRGPTGIVMTDAVESGGEVVLEGNRLSSIGAIKVNDIRVPFMTNVDGSINFNVPNLPSGDYKVVFEVPLESVNILSDIQITGNNVILDSESTESTQKLNAGSFKGYVAVYAKGYEGKRLSAKIGNDWVIVPSLESDFERITDFTGAGVDIQVRIFIDGELMTTIPLTTK